jgi:hypothetical protein
VFHTISLVKFRKRVWPVIKIAIIVGIILAACARVYIAISS